MKRTNDRSCIVIKWIFAYGSELKYKKFENIFLRGGTHMFMSTLYLIYCFLCQDSYSYFPFCITVHRYLLVLPRPADNPETNKYGITNSMRVLIKLLLRCLYLFCKLIQH